MKNPRKRLIRNLFREGNRLMSKAIHSQLSPITDYGNSLKLFRMWCGNVELISPKIRLYFRRTYHKAFEVAKKEYHRPRYKDCITGELISQADADRIMMEEKLYSYR